MPVSGRFQRLVEEHKGRVYAAVHRLLGRHDESLDVLQETLLELHQRLSSVADAWAGPWLLRVATNRSLDRLRRREREGRALSIRQERAAPPRAGDPEALAEQRELRGLCLAALDRISGRQRDVVTLRIFHELSFVVIAETLGISEGATKVHFRRGLSALRRRLAPLKERAEPGD